MNVLSKRSMRLSVLAGTLSISAMILSGCASPPTVACSEPVPLPAALSAPQSPDAKAFSEKVQNFLPKAEAYFKETPAFTTPSSELSDK